jgi:glutaredoxin
MQQQKMNIPAPDPSGFTIYTKQGCKFCAHAKRVFATAIFYSCDKWLLTDRDAFLEQMDKHTEGFRMFPMIFKDGKFLGGYTESVQKTMMDLDF